MAHGRCGEAHAKLGAHEMGNGDRGKHLVHVPRG
jgi:hypothetical protein